MIHLFFKTHNVQQQKRSRENRENMLYHEQKDRGDVKLQFRAIKSLNNAQDRRYTTI